MRKLALIRLFIIALVISSCTPAVVEDVPSQPAPVKSEAAVQDYLIYKIVEPPGKGQYSFYDPIKDSHTPLLSDWSINAYSMNLENRLAFSGSKDGKGEIYLLDFPFADHSPVRITDEASAANVVISWSPDGRYLAYATIGADEKTLSVWDGDKSSIIYRYQDSITEFTWSADGRLAFSDLNARNSSNQRDAGEIYVWDGSETTSVSQNPSGIDRYPAWNNQGALAFLTERDREFDILVWDGKSKIDGQPDLKSFKNIAPELTAFYSEPVWTHSGTLTFISQEKDSRAQIYEWDGQAAQNISQNPDSNNGGQRWSSDGHWAFATFSSPTQMLFIRDSQNQTQLSVEGQKAPAWSEGGRLMFCALQEGEWSLMIWDGTTVRKIAHGPLIEAEWNNGAQVSCSGR